jgi:hypothetical protein
MNTINNDNRVEKLEKILDEIISIYDKQSPEDKKRMLSDIIDLENELEAITKKD